MAESEDSITTKALFSERRQKRIQAVESAKLNHSATIIQSVIRGRIYRANTRKIVFENDENVVNEASSSSVATSASVPAFASISSSSPSFDRIIGGKTSLSIQSQSEGGNQNAATDKIGMWSSICIKEKFDDADWPELDSTPSPSECENKPDGNKITRWIKTNKKVLLRTVTWNLEAQPPPEVDKAIIELLPRNKFHLYAIGSEECERSIAQSALLPGKEKWEQYLRSVVGPLYEPLR